MTCVDGAIGGCLAGFVSAACAYGASVTYAKYHPPNKQSNPSEWAIWKRMNRKGSRYVTSKDVKSLCYRFGAGEFAETLSSLMDPYGFNMITFRDVVFKFPHIQTMRTAARLKLWHRTVGIGVAGNVAGHMAQAGEGSADSTKATKPTALFVYYMPKPAFHVSDKAAELSRLQSFPVTYAVIRFPRIQGAMRVQVEPELGLYVDIVYTKDRTSIDYLVPRRVAAFNDCSIRVLDGAEKLSMKKNWGFASKGISLRSIEIDSFSAGSYVDRLVIISYLKRNEHIEQYSVAAPCRNYLMFNEPLLEWIVDSANTQTNCDKWEPIFPALVENAYPNAAWIACGAGEYTEWGATNYIQVGDEVTIMLYDESLHPNGPTMQMVEASFDDQAAPQGIVDLHQSFV